MSYFDRARFDNEQTKPFATIKPSTARRPARPLAAVGTWLRAWRRRQEFNRLVARLLTYDDHQLDDLGYARQDLLTAIDLPLKMDAQRLLARWRERRIAREGNT